MGIAIVTDSTAYFTQQEIKDFAPNIVPLTVSIGEHQFDEGTAISNAEFYKIIRQSTEFPTSSQPAVGAFVEVYQKLLANHEEIISIHLSGRLSGTVQAARNAAEIVDKKSITVIDSLSVAQGISAMVIEASKMSLEGQSKSAICSKIDYMIDHTQIYFLIETLDYLHKGGRIGGAEALFGNLLQIKPILYLNEGMVELFEKVRTEKKASQRFIELVERIVEDMDPNKVCIKVCHADNYPKAMELVNLISEKIPKLNVEVGELGPVIGMHGGPGTCGAIISKL